MSGLGIGLFILGTIILTLALWLAMVITIPDEVKE